MDKSIRAKFYAGILILTVTTFLIIFFFDGISGTIDLFGESASLFSRQMKNGFGKFAPLILSMGIYLGFMLLLRLNLSTKLYTAGGYCLLILFLPPFFQTLNQRAFVGGYYGSVLARFFIQPGLFFAIVLYFLWFLLSVFLILYPFKEKIVCYLVDLFFYLTALKSTNPARPCNQQSKNKHKSKVNARNKREMPPAKKNHAAHKRTKIENNKPKIPWLSKVVYESPQKRVEIPVIPQNDEKIRKFKLTGQGSQNEEYEEVDTFSGKYANLVYKEIDENEIDYFERIKQDWPQNWKDEKKDRSNPLQLEDQRPDIENIEDEPLDIVLVEENKETDLKKNDDQKMININQVEEADHYEVIVDNAHLLSKEQPGQIDFEKINAQNFNQQDNFVDGNDFDDALPKSSLLRDSRVKNGRSEFKKEENEAARILENTLMEFGIKAEVSDIIHGPVVTLFKLIPAPGIKLSKIEGLSNNLALRLAAKSIRIIAPIPGEKVVGIEIPNKKRELVSFKEVINSEEFTESNFQVPIGLGKDIYGKIIVIDLYRMPHILIAGATGAGKSVCVNSFLSSILFSCTPSDVRVILIDPKIVELKPYNNIPHLLAPVITDSKKAITALKYLIFEMEKRYFLLDQVGVRDIAEYRKLQANKASQFEQLPFIITFVDEFADLMSTSGKEAEMLFARLTAKARAVGIHLVLATQRPSTDVITGLIKANVPARIAFQVISLQDSRIILDQKGAEKLLGQGDMLYLSPTQPFPIRLQGAFLSKEEVDTIASHWKEISQPEYINFDEILDEDDSEQENGDDYQSKDPLFDEAVQIIIHTGKASASYLQRRLNIGYNRAARLIEEMEAMGIVGPLNGSKPRDVLIDYYDNKG